MARLSRQEFYEDLRKYLRGEPNGIRAGTIGGIKADIARDLVAQEPSLVEDKDRLLETVERLYEERHVVKVTLSSEDVALAEMLATPKDNLPQA